MGVSGLWDAVAAAGLCARIEALHGRKCAIDASFWIAHALVSQENLRRGFDIYAIFFLKICYLLETRIRPIFVFDGIPPDAKRRTLLKRKLMRERRGINHKLLAYKAITSQIGKSKVPKPRPAIEDAPLFDPKELEDIANELEKPQPAAEPLFNIDFSNVIKRESTEDAIPPKFNVLCMPRSYKALKWFANRGINMDNEEFGSVTYDFLKNYIPPDIMPEAVNDFVKQELPPRPHGIQLPLDAEINKDIFDRLPHDVKYQIMNQIRDAWVYDDRIQSIKLKDGLDSFSKLQVEGYIRNCMINKELDQVKTQMAASIENAILKNKADDVDIPKPSQETFDYNAVVPKRPRKQKRFLNDLSVDMTPDYFALTELNPMPIVKKESQPITDVDDDVFVSDAELFGDLNNDDEFETVDSIDTTPQSLDPIVAPSTAATTTSTGRDEPCLKELNVTTPPIVDPLQNHTVATDHDVSTGITRLATLLHENLPNVANLASGSDGSPELGMAVSTVLPDLDIKDYESDSLEDVELNYDDYENGEDGFEQEESQYDMQPDGAGTTIIQTGYLDESTHQLEHEELQISLDTPGDEDIVQNKEKGPCDAGSSESIIGGLLEQAVVPVENDTNELPHYYEFRSQLYKMQRYSQSLESLEKICEMLDLFGIPYMHAPSEAEAQCCFLNQSGEVYAVISDDSDTLPFGARRILKNFFNSRVFEIYLSSRIKSELGLSQEQLALLAIICGCDYTDGVCGIGIVNALEVIKAYPTFNDLYAFRAWATTDVDLKNATKDECPIREAYKKAHINYRVHWKFSCDFPNLEAYTLFLKPRIDKRSQFKWTPPQVPEIKQFMTNNSSLPPEQIDACLNELQRRRVFQYLIQDLMPEITCRNKKSKSRAESKKALKANKARFKADLNELKNKKCSLKRLKIYRDKTPVAIIKSRRMKESFDVILKRSKQLTSTRDAPE
ncbi:bifunctional XPG [Babesia duncani]|uniref:Bifunctional XPG n=2 Tax=Babesia TaxID=5864 RepID=A0AAD9PPG1_9APIC|nr:unknown [Babesia sp. WA1]KAK2198471.1 bifunctional XPG [Babesia duncani]